MYTNKDANQFKKELKTLIRAKRIHPEVMYVAVKAVYGEIHNGAQIVSKSATGVFSDNSEDNRKVETEGYHIGCSPYEKGELEMMFQHLSPERLPNWKPYKLFIPALALFHGLRMNEACQLQLGDIIRVNGMPCIRVESSGKTVDDIKSRTIPIHPVILQLGFLKFIEEVKSGSLWPELSSECSNKEYVHHFGNFFNFFNREFVTKDNTKLFRSLRLNFIEVTSSAPEAIVDYGFDIFAQTGIEPLSECEVAEQVEHFFDRPF